MPLPLMPGSEPVQVQKAPEPELTSRGTAYFGNPLGVLEGCNCESCQWELRRLRNIPREQAPRPGLLRGTCNTPGTALHGAVRWLDPITGTVYDDADRPQWTFVQQGSRWVDARASGYEFQLDVPEVPPMAIFNWEVGPIPEPAGPNQGCIRGVYDPDSPDGGLFRGELRWLDPADGAVYDAGGNRMNTLTQYDGVWQNYRGGTRWIPA